MMTSSAAFEPGHPVQESWDPYHLKAEVTDPFVFEPRPLPYLLSTPRRIHTSALGDYPRLIRSHLLARGPSHVASAS
jgi:hypothetical protein